MQYFNSKYNYCNGVNLNFPSLGYGDNVAITGKWVQDRNALDTHGKEIHPAAKSKKRSRRSPRLFNSFEHHGQYLNGSRLAKVGLIDKL